MLLRAGKKRAKEVSLFEPIGTDKDGETVSLVDVIEMENPKTIDQLILDQDIKELYQPLTRNLRKMKNRSSPCAMDCLREKSTPSGK